MNSSTPPNPEPSLPMNSNPDGQQLTNWSNRRRITSSSRNYSSPSNSNCNSPNSSFSCSSSNNQPNNFRIYSGPQSPPTPLPNTSTSRATTSSTKRPPRFSALSGFPSRRQNRRTSPKARPKYKMIGLETSSAKSPDSLTISLIPKTQHPDSKRTSKTTSTSSSSDQNPSAFPPTPVHSETFLAPSAPSSVPSATKQAPSAFQTGPGSLCQSVAHLARMIKYPCKIMPTSSKTERWSIAKPLAPSCADELMIFVK